MGLIIAAGNTKPAFPYDYYYGVRIKTTVAATTLERIGRPELHTSLPVQSKMRRCVLRDNGTVAYYLHATDSTKRDTGAAANLTGADGQVMVEIPKHYRKFEFDGTDLIALISEYPLPGFHEVPKMYRSAYEATVDRTVAATPKLASVVNTTAAFRGGNNNTAYDGTYRSFLGLPATGISLTNFRNYARNRGTAGLNGKGWNCDLYAAQLATYWLFVIEYANLNCQAAFNAQPDANGYKQGGLGPGVTEISSGNWNTFNGYYPFVPCGTTNSFGNATGVVDYTINNGAGITHTAHVPSYRGIENPFGHIWSWTDGCKCEIQSEADGGLSKFYVCNDPAKFQDSSYNDYDYRGNLPRSEGYVKRIMAGEYGENMPVEVGGGSTIYFADYFYTNIPTSGTAMRGVLFGGRANDGAIAGLADANTDHAASSTFAYIGSRLCFYTRSVTRTPYDNENPLTRPNRRGPSIRRLGSISDQKMNNETNPTQDDGTLAFLNIPQDENNKHFNCHETTQQKLINLSFYVLDFIDGVKTKFGAERFLVKIKHPDNSPDKPGQEEKFFTNSTEIKYVLREIKKRNAFPRKVTMRASGTRYYFE